MKQTEKYTVHMEEVLKNSHGTEYNRSTVLKGLYDYGDELVRGIAETAKRKVRELEDYIMFEEGAFIEPSSHNDDYFKSYTLYHADGSQIILKVWADWLSPSDNLPRKNTPFTAYSCLGLMVTRQELRDGQPPYSKPIETKHLDDDTMAEIPRDARRNLYNREDINDDDVVEYLYCPLEMKKDKPETYERIRKAVYEEIEKAAIARGAKYTRKKPSKKD